MLKTLFRVLITIILFSGTANSQSQDTALKLPFPVGAVPVGPGHFCATDLLLQAQRGNAAFVKAEEKMNREVAAAIRLFDVDSVVLPVVFHVIADDPYSIADKVLLDGLADLNNAFAKRGAWSASKGVDTKIRFCLAQKDPDGGNTTGITRVTSHWGNHVNPTIEDGKLKATAQWDPARYINIWYVKNIDLENFVNFSCGVWSRLGVAGYATLPPGGGALDGIVVTGFGNLIAHEMGHYLGLYHTFEGFCTNNDCLLNGDRVCDTPPDGSYLSSPCNSPSNTCHTDTLSNYSNGHFKTDVPDPIENIMDYGLASCQNTFTQGQADRMMNAINTQRSGLLEAKCLAPCKDNVLALFRRNIDQPKQGDEVEFKNNSTGANTYQWFVDGAQVSTAQDFKYTFNQQGRFKVTLKAFKDNSCYGSFSEFVKVDCGVAARFYTDKLAIASEKVFYEDSIRFTNNSYNATQYKWLVGHDKGMAEQVVSTGPHLTYRFDVFANYTFRLVASNGQCSDTTLLYPVAVQDPKADGVPFMNAIHCYQQTKIRVNFYICNYGYDTLPANTPVSFYNADPRLAGAKKVGTTFYIPSDLPGHCCSWLFTHIVDVGAPGLNELWLSFNDNGASLPLSLPNTPYVEKNYLNNLAVSKNFQMKATPIPSTLIMEPGDTAKLNVVAGPTPIATFLWSPPDRLSCTTCQSPNYIADTMASSVKQVIVTSIYSCYDTTGVVVKVPPYNDFRVRVDSAECTGSDSIRVNFTLFNDFKRGVLPKGLTVRFYASDPFTAGAVWLGPTFSLSDTIHLKQAGFTTTIASMVNTTIFALVNDSNGAPPIVLPNTGFQEKNYSNNLASFNYQRLHAAIAPSSAVLEPGDTLTLKAGSFPGSGIKYQWWPTAGFNCTQCSEPQYVADTTRLVTKTVIAENAYGCKDTAFATISVPPYHDFRALVDSAECSGTDSIFLTFRLFNDFKRPVLPKGLTVRFYNGNPQLANAQWLPPAFILKDSIVAGEALFATTIKKMPTGNLYAAVNDSTGTPPVSFPNTWIEEKNYTNNFGQTSYVKLEVATTPLSGLIEPGDTLALDANAAPGPIVSYTWTPAYNLSCKLCKQPYLYADTTTQKRVVAFNRFGCSDTAYLQVNIPPSDDFTLTVNETACAAGDSMYVNFTARNLFRRGILPKGLTLRFYDADPRQAGANELQPPYIIPANYIQQSHAFSTLIRQSHTGKLFVSINDSGIAKPLVFPSGKRLEKDYTNNVVQVDYTPEKLLLSPADTLITRGASFNATILNTLDNPGSTNWQKGNGYSLSCTQCITPFVTATQPSAILVESLNRFRCALKGTLQVRILPPDFTIRINHTECINNQTTRVHFTICMNNGYDSVWKNIPVAFYEGDPGPGNARVLSPVFYTRTAVPSGCADYSQDMSSPLANSLFARVNDKGNASSPGADIAFSETDESNNIAEAKGFRLFAVHIHPPDTTIEREGQVTLFTSAEGGNFQSVQWKANPFLSCTNCFSPVVKPTYTNRYIVTAYNEHQCSDTAMATVRTVTLSDFNIPNAFTPNQDGLNDIFYVIGSKRITILKDFLVYNRFGEIVFEAHNIPANDPQFGWTGMVHGKMAEAGAFVYRVAALMEDGKTENLKGTIVLIR